MKTSIDLGYSKANKFYDIVETVAPLIAVGAAITGIICAYEENKYLTDLAIRGEIASGIIAIVTCGIDAIHKTFSNSKIEKSDLSTLEKLSLQL